MPSSLADSSNTSAHAPMLRPATTGAGAGTAKSTLAAIPNVPFLVPQLRPMQPASAAAAHDAAALPGIRYTQVVVKPGDTLLSALARGGVSAADASRSLPKLKGQIDPRKLQPGDKLVLGFLAGQKEQSLAAVRWDSQHGKDASITLLPGAAKPVVATADAGLVVKTLAVLGSPSLPRTLTESGLPPQVSEQVVMAISQSRKPPVHGEMLTIVYKEPKDPHAGGTPRLSYASYRGRDGKAHTVSYTALPTPSDLKNIDVLPAAMVALWDPMPGARISSPFGWRIHPVFHTRMFHKGIDYEVGAGTPVIATADGIVEDVGWRGNYGNYIRVRHSGRLETAYAHMAGFSPIIAVGTPVRRGDVIGYVGMTGVATGPHLYYEVLVDGLQIDPEGSELKEATRHLSTQTAGVN